MADIDLIAHALRLPNKGGREWAEIPSWVFVLKCEATRADGIFGYLPPS